MSHTLFVGMTESGKTTLARSLAERYKASGVRVIVCDAAHNPWTADFQTASLNEFIKVAASSRGCALFIDEAGQYLQPGSAATDVATMFRHLGHFAHFIGQRPTMIAPDIRHNCKRVALFKVSRYDATELEREWGRPEIATAPDLAAGEYLLIDRFSPVLRLRAWPIPT